MNWQVGDIAIVRNTVNGYFAPYVGTECEIIVINPPGYPPPVAYEVRLCDELLVGAATYHLCRRDDRVDDKDTCEWSDIEKDCGWRPKEPITVGAEDNEEVHIIDHRRLNT